MREALLYVSGLGVGVANAARHRVQGYKTPRRFASDDYERAAPYDLKVVDRWQRYGADFAGRRVLEIGPGPDLGTGALMLARGAKSYLAVDRFPLAANVPDDFYRGMGADPADLNYQQAEFPALPEVSGPFDLVVSNATLEHVDDVARLFARLGELVPPGGRMMHYVDAKTHTRWFTDRDPLNVFRYDPRIYRLMRFPGMLNRLLADDYRRAAERAGFAVRVEPGKSAPDGYLASVRLDRRFAGRSDLRLLSFAVICTR